MSRKYVVLMCILLILGSALIEASNTVVRYPRPETDFDKRSLYPTKLLQLALDRVDKDYRLVASPLIMNQGRALIQLRKGVNVDVVWSMTSRERESNLRPIRIPIHKGLIGWRLFLINVRDRYNLERKLTLDLLQKYKFVQGHDWPDADILEAAGLTIFRSPAYSTIMNMLDAGRFDAYPIGMNEVKGELDKRPSLNLIGEQSIVLSYLAPVFIFINLENMDLQASLKSGFDNIIRDGSFDKIFNSHYQGLVAKTKINQRKVFKLNNPGMSDTTREAMKNYSSMLIVR